MPSGIVMFSRTFGSFFATTWRMRGSTKKGCAGSALWNRYVGLFHIARSRRSAVLVDDAWEPEMCVPATDRAGPAAASPLAADATDTIPGRRPAAGEGGGLPFQNREMREEMAGHVY